jgi:protein-S-isoprenylcysteine O-methyltransferase Ste14
MRVNFGQLAIRIAGTAVVFTLALFVPAGTLDWPAGWAFLALFFAFTLALSLWLLRFNPELLEERLTGIGKPSQKAWDKVLLAIIAVAFFAWFAVMGLDAVRFRWSRLPVWLQGLGALLLVISFYVFYLTFRENPFLSPAVRIQSERAQRVISTGPYSWVRHPLYAGFAVFALGTALMLGSRYGLVGALILIGIVARRAVLEERVLRDELDGYGAYVTQVRYRLIPYLW